jgi:hypothetical protein
MRTREELKEELADLAHKMWIHWMNHIFSVCCEPNCCGDVHMRGPEVSRWLRQMGTEYKDLSEKEKESDRVQAEKMLSIIEDWVNDFKKDLDDQMNTW